MREFAFFDLDSLACDVANERGKRLIEPDVIKPLHRDHVAKPLVRQLMLHYHVEHNPFTGLHLLWFLICQTDLRVGDAACRLHSCVSHIWTKHMVKLFKRKLKAKKLMFVKLDSALNQNSDIPGV